MSTYMGRCWKCDTCEQIDNIEPWKCPICGEETCDRCFWHNGVCKPCWEHLGGDEEVNKILVEKGYSIGEED